MQTLNNSKINFIFDPLIIEDCLKDINQSFNKDEFMINMINKRIYLCEKVYMDEIDKNLDNLIQTNDLKQLSKIIKKLCKLSENLYKTEIEVFKKLL